MSPLYWYQKTVAARGKYFLEETGVLLCGAKLERLFFLLFHVTWVEIVLLVFFLSLFLFFAAFNYASCG